MLLYIIIHIYIIKYIYIIKHICYLYYWTILNYIWLNFLLNSINCLLVFCETWIGLLDL